MESYPNSVYIDLSTSSPTLIREIHVAYQDQNVHVLDAPVSGGPVGAQAATLAVMVGGDPAIYERVKPVLDAIGNKVSYVGGIGCGLIAKIVHNMVSNGFRALLAEGLTVGVKAGVAPEALRRAIADGAMGQGLTLNHTPAATHIHRRFRYRPLCFASRPQGYWARHKLGTGV